MSALVDFLLARIDEEQQVARAAQAERRRITYRDGHPASEPDYEDHAFEVAEDIGVPAVLVGAERALAECAAKREVVTRVRDTEWGSYAVRDVVLAALVLPYVAHPDFREEWRA